MYSALRQGGLTRVVYSILVLLSVQTLWLIFPTIIHKPTIEKNHYIILNLVFRKWKSSRQPMKDKVDHIWHFAWSIPASKHTNRIIPRSYWMAQTSLSTPKPPLYCLLNISLFYVTYPLFGLSRSGEFHRYCWFCKRWGCVPRCTHSVELLVCMNGIYTNLQVESSFTYYEVLLG